MITIKLGGKNYKVSETTEKRLRSIWLNTYFQEISFQEFIEEISRLELQLELD